mgnify:FL=1
MRENRRQYLYVIQELTSREIKRKYARSYLGIIWSVLNPLLTMAVISAVFSTMFRRSIENFPIYYLTGYIIWQLYSEATRASMTVLVDNKNLLIKTKIPKIVFVMSRAYTALTNFFFSCIAYALILAIFRIAPSLVWLFFFYDLLIIMIFSIGVGAILSIMYVFFADIKHLYSVILTLLMYLSAIFYPVDRLPDVMKVVLDYNPIYLFIYIMRVAVMDGQIPDTIVLIKATLFAVVFFAAGIITFNKKQNDVMIHI